MCDRTTFPSAAPQEGRERVKGLFARLDMDGSVQAFAERWGLTASAVTNVQVELADQTTFLMNAYLAAQSMTT